MSFCQIQLSLVSIKIIFRMAKVITTKDDIIQQEIVQGALQLFQKYGLNKVTMEDVAKAIGKGRSSLYYYYKNREEIFAAVLDTFIQEIIQEITASVQKAATLELKIQAFCWSKLKTSEQRRVFYRAIESGMGAEEISKHTIAMTTFHLQLMDLEAEILRQVLLEAVTKKEIKAITKKETDLHIFILLSSIRGIKRELLFNQDKMKEIKFIILTLGQMMIKSLQWYFF